MSFKKSSVLTFVTVVFILSIPFAPTHAEGIFNFLKKKPASQESTGSDESDIPVYNVPKDGSSSVAPLFIIPPKAQNYTTSYTYKGGPYTARPILKAKSGMSLVELTELNKYNRHVIAMEEKERRDQMIAQLHWQYEQDHLKRKKQAQEEQQQEIRKMVYPKKDTAQKKPRLLFSIPD